MRQALLLSLCLFFAAAAKASPPGVTGADAAEIRAVIYRQIDAFRRDDAAGAFALVSPSVREAFGTPQRFLEVVRMAYRPVYRPASVVFLDMVVIGGEVVQQVQLTDRGGLIWVAYYSMQRQDDGRWRTNGCRLRPPVRTIPA